MFHLFLYFSIHLSLPLPLSPSLSLSFSLFPDYEKHVFERYMYIAHSVSKFSNACFVVCSFLPFFTYTINAENFGACFFLPDSGSETFIFLKTSMPFRELNGALHYLEHTQVPTHLHDTEPFTTQNAGP